MLTIADVKHCMSRVSDHGGVAVPVQPQRPSVPHDVHRYPPRNWSRCAYGRLRLTTAIAHEQGADRGANRYRQNREEASHAA